MRLYQLHLFVKSDLDRSEVDYGRFEVEAGQPIAQALDAIGFVLRRDCGGNGICNKCSVEVAPLITFDSKEELPDFESVCACRQVVDNDIVVCISSSNLLSAPDSFLSSPNHQKPIPPLFAQISRKLGIAVDLGTTTLVIALVDLNSREIIANRTTRNPQAIYGQDVIARIQYGMKEEQNVKKMQRLVVDRLQEMIESLATEAPFNLGDVEKICVAGNSVMTSIFLDLEVAPFGRYPFQPPQMVFEPIEPGETLFPCCPNATMTIVPLFAGFVGGDIVAGIVALRRQGKQLPPDGITLFLDLGTNGEMALLLGDKPLYVAATAAGPAFEGVGIRFGTIATPGAIESVKVQLALNGLPLFTINVIGEGNATGICGSGLIDAAAEMIRNQLLDTTGRFKNNGNSSSTPWIEYLEADKGVRLLPDAPDVWILQRDIRQLQLATGAIRAGVKLLLELAGYSPGDLTMLCLAGTFGSAIDLRNAQQIGLLPPEIAIERIEFMGNSSLQGAALLLLDETLWADALTLVKDVTHIDLSSLPNFNDCYIHSLNFP